jgi:hypothetical protein
MTSWSCARALTLALVSSIVFLSPASAQTERVWVDVNLGVATSQADDETYVYDFQLFSEPAALAVAYPKPSRGASFDFGGGYMFTPKLGVGISFVGTAHEDPAGLGATIPHPFFFNATTVVSGATDEELSRSEAAAHLQLMFAPVHTERVRVRVFGGPSVVRYQAEMVQDLQFLQTATPLSRLNQVTLNGFQFVDVEGTGFGFHVGADVSYFFTRVVGIGGFGRFNRGTVEIDEPLSETKQDVTVGGFQFGAGLRLRF